MGAAAEKLLHDILALPEDERVEIAAEIIASLDGAPDRDWDEAWISELDRRRNAAETHGDGGTDWTEVRARVLRRLGRSGT